MLVIFHINSFNLFRYIYYELSLHGLNYKSADITCLRDGHIQSFIEPLLEFNIRIFYNDVIVPSLFYPQTGTNISSICCRIDYTKECFSFPNPSRSGQGRLSAYTSWNAFNYFL